MMTLVEKIDVFSAEKYGGFRHKVKHFQHWKYSPTEESCSFSSLNFNALKIFMNILSALTSAQSLCHFMTETSISAWFCRKYFHYRESCCFDNIWCINLNIFPFYLYSSLNRVVQLHILHSMHTFKGLKIYIQLGFWRDRRVFWYFLETRDDEAHQRILRIVHSSSPLRIDNATHHVYSIISIHVVLIHFFLPRNIWWIKELLD